MASMVREFVNDTLVTLRGMNMRELAQQLVSLGAHTQLSPALQSRALVSSATPRQRAGALGMQLSCRLNRLL